MRVRRGFLPQPPQGAPWRLAAVREDDIAHTEGARRVERREAVESWRAVPSVCGNIYVSFRYDERLSFMTNCSGGAIFPEIEISLRINELEGALSKTLLPRLANPIKNRRGTRLIMPVKLTLVFAYPTFYCLLRAVARGRAQETRQFRYYRNGNARMPGIQEGTRSLGWILVANLRAIEFASYSYSLDEYGKFNHFQGADFVSAYHDAFESPDKSGWARDISKFALGRSEIFHFEKLCLNCTFVIMLQFSLLLQSHATVIPRHIQEQRVKQDWSFSS
ncbi:hypothetical protein ALC56_03857 [Trachymyrmex septentrionalis]|uniref:Uncharacterized protein n=1 Tax=Trachymyrmex septentrionalis TaxID=34720 RepID=A0A195FP44_9HYME|nr:hypothetical protein ALC56_03857 [Trachymyrmex septentrionalis]